MSQFAVIQLIRGGKCDVMLVFVTSFLGIQKSFEACSFSDFGKISNEFKEYLYCIGIKTEQGIWITFNVAEQFEK